MFNLSINITKIINEEINEINNYIKNYTYKYFEENIYNMNKNIFYFKKAFTKEEMKKLLNEFYLLLNRTIKEHFKELIDYNFNLSNQVFDEENRYFSIYSGEDRRFMASGFISRYHEYKAKFEEFLVLTYSEEFLNLLEKYFYKLRDDILNLIKRKISFNKYYFYNDLYKELFYFQEQINENILEIIDIINDYYNEINLDGDIKIKAMNLKFIQELQIIM